MPTPVRDAALLDGVEEFKKPPSVGVLVPGAGLDPSDAGADDLGLDGLDAVAGERCDDLPPPVRRQQGCFDRPWGAPEQGQHGDRVALERDNLAEGRVRPPLGEKPVGDVVRVERPGAGLELDPITLPEAAANRLQGGKRGRTELQG